MHKNFSMKKIPCYICLGLTLCLTCACTKEMPIPPDISDESVSAPALNEISEPIKTESSTPNIDYESQATVEYDENATHKITAAIYREDSREKIASFEIKDEKYCRTLFQAFYYSFEKACKEHPRDVAIDCGKRTEYRVMLYLYTYQDEAMTQVQTCIKISYPYGYTNDIYRLEQFDPFGDYIIQCGKPFIDIIDKEVSRYIPH